jgi:transposase-like protein
VKHASRPAIFKERQTAPELILCTVRWYLRYALSFRDVEELLAERGLAADYTTVWRGVQRYGPERMCCNFENCNEGSPRKWTAGSQDANSNSWSMK